MKSLMFVLFLLFLVSCGKIQNECGKDIDGLCVFIDKVNPHYALVKVFDVNVRKIIGDIDVQGKLDDLLRKMNHSNRLSDRELRGLLDKLVNDTLSNNQGKMLNKIIITLNNHRDDLRNIDIGDNIEYNIKTVDSITVSLENINGEVSLEESLDQFYIDNNCTVILNDTFVGCEDG